ncbi:unnamed protein product [Amoebophrya sp. A120]|nr:unnamed protein product [Amoebophrya sp. A120]|eukprot:GSA120T00023909001.1
MISKNISMEVNISSLESKLFLLRKKLHKVQDEKRWQLQLRDRVFSSFVPANYEFRQESRKWHWIKTQAAVRIQKSVRGYFTRKYLSKTIYPAFFDENTKLLNEAKTTRLLPQLLELRRQCHSLLYDRDEEKRNASATLIQKTWRGARVYRRIWVWKRFFYIKRQLELEVEAVTILASFWRGYKQRFLFQHQLELIRAENAAIVIQRFWRRWLRDLQMIVGRFTTFMSEQERSEMSDLFERQDECGGVDDADQHNDSSRGRHYNKNNNLHLYGLLLEQHDEQDHTFSFGEGEASEKHDLQEPPALHDLRGEKIGVGVGGAPSTSSGGARTRTAITTPTTTTSKRGRSRFGAVRMQSAHWREKKDESEEIVELDGPPALDLEKHKHHANDTTAADEQVSVSAATSCSAPAPPSTSSSSSSKTKLLERVRTAKSVVFEDEGERPEIKNGGANNFSAHSCTTATTTSSNAMKSSSSTPRATAIQGKNAAGKNHDTRTTTAIQQRTTTTRGVPAAKMASGVEAVTLKTAPDSKTSGTTTSSTSSRRTNTTSQTRKSKNQHACASTRMRTKEGDNNQTAGVPGGPAGAVPAPSSSSTRPGVVGSATGGGGKKLKKKTTRTRIDLDAARTTSTLDSEDVVVLGTSSTTEKKGAVGGAGQQRQERNSDMNQVKVSSSSASVEALVQDEKEGDTPQSQNDRTKAAVVVVEAAESNGVDVDCPGPPASTEEDEAPQFVHPMLDIDLDTIQHLESRGDRDGSAHPGRSSALDLFLDVKQYSPLLNTKDVFSP